MKESFSAYRALVMYGPGYEVGAVATTGWALAVTRNGQLESLSWSGTLVRFHGICHDKLRTLGRILYRLVKESEQVEAAEFVLVRVTE